MSEVKIREISEEEFKRFCDVVCEYRPTERYMNPNCKLKEARCPLYMFLKWLGLEHWKWWHVEKV